MTVEWTWVGISKYEAEVTDGVLLVDTIAAGLYVGRYHCRVNPSRSRTSGANRTSVAEAKADAEALV